MFLFRHKSHGNYVDGGHFCVDFLVLNGVAFSRQIGSYRAVTSIEF